MQFTYIRCVIVVASFFLVVVDLALAGPTPTPPPPPPTPPPIPAIDAILEPTATIVLSTSESAVAYCAGGLFQLVGLPQNPVAQVTVHYPTAQALQLVKVQPLDGGEVIIADDHRPPANLGTSRIGTGIIGNDGAFTFTFRVGSQPGLYQIRIQQGTQVLGMQFWIDDPMHPENNPPVLRPARPVQ